MKPEFIIKTRTYNINTEEFMKHFGITNEEISSIRMGDYHQVGRKNPINIIVQTEERVNE